MAIQNDIRAALESHLNEINGLPSVAWQGVQFDPSAGTSFVRVEMAPLQTRYAHQLRTLQTGTFRVTVYTSIHVGPNSTDTIVDSILAQFTPGRRLTSGSVAVRIQSAEVGASSIVDESYAIPVDISYWSHNVFSLIPVGQYQPDAADLIMATLAPAISMGTNIDVPVSAIQVATLAPTATQNSIRVPGAVGLDMNCPAPVVAWTDNRDITVPVVGLVMNCPAPVVSTSAAVDIEVPVASIQVATVAPTAAVSDNQSVTVPVAGLQVAGVAPTVAQTTNASIDVPVASLAISTVAPQIGGNVAITVPVTSLVASTAAPSVVATDNRDIEVPVAGLVAGTVAPAVAVSDNQSVDVPVAGLVASTTAPSVSATANVDITVPVAALAVGTAAPDVSTGASVNITVPVAGLVAATVTPSVTHTTTENITVPVASLVATTVAPSVSAGASVNITVPVASVAIAGVAPAVTEAWTITVPVAGVQIAGVAPAVVATANVDITVPVAGLVATTVAPTAAVSDNQAITVPVAGLVASTVAPTAATTANVSIDVPVAGLVAGTIAPTVTATDNVAIDMPVASLAISTAAPTVLVAGGGTEITIPVAAVTVAGVAPTAAGGFNPAANLVYHWMLDDGSGTNADEEIDNEDGTLSAGVSWSTTRQVGSYSCDFDGGSTAIITLPTSVSVSGSAMTICMWVRFDAIEWNCLLNRGSGDGGGQEGYEWNLGQYPNNDFEVGLRTASDYQFVSTSSNPFSTATWYHVALRYTGSALQGVIDGSQVSTTGCTGNLRTATPDRLRLGIGPPSSGYAEHDGLIDDVRIYSAALTDAELEAIMDIT